MIRRITDKILEKMKMMRRRGATYSEIMDALGVSKWACMNYLKRIEVDEAAIEKEWREAEIEAKEYLKARGFIEFHDLNEIYPSPHWDILAKKDDDEWWLIDVTISPNPKIGTKAPHFAEGYVHAILYKDINSDEWMLVKLSYELVERKELDV